MFISDSPVPVCCRCCLLEGAGSGVLLVPILGWSLVRVGPDRDLLGEEEGSGVLSGPGEARTILLLHIIHTRTSKQPLMVRTFFKVYMEISSYFLFHKNK